MKFIFDTPWYFVLISIAVAVAYSLLLYFWDKGKLHLRDDFSKSTAYLLASFRFVAVFLIAFLLLGPLARREVNQVEKPIILVAQDNSKSLNYCPDSAFYRDDYAENVKKILAKLGKDYDVQCFTYGSELNETDAPDYSEPVTDMASALTQLGERFSHRNVGAMILSGDGIYNQGSNPIAAASQLPFPIYTVSMGDTALRKDAAIVEVRHNSMAYLGNQFSIEVSVSATSLRGAHPTLSVSKGDKTLFSKRLDYTDDRFFHSEVISLEADKPGLQSYSVAIGAAEGEVTLRNNTVVIPIDVIDGRQKILILAAAPHPDLSALRQSMEENKNYEADCFIAGDFKGNVEDYNLVVLHQLPAKGINAPIVEKVQKAHVPMLYVVGRLTDIPRLNSMGVGVEVRSKLDRQNECTPVLNKSFSLFTLDEDDQRRIEQYPPLVTPFGEYKLSSNAQALFFSKIGNVSSSVPMAVFSQQQDIRVGVILGEGIWRWRMEEYQAHQSHATFDNLVAKMLNYTSLQLGKDRFHVTAKKVYHESNNVTIQAELYNDSYEPVNNPEATIAISSEGRQPTSYTFNRKGNAYEISLGILPPGEYHYTASTTLNGTKMSAKGSFLVQQLNLEETSLVADNALLNTIAKNSQAEMLSSHDIDRLPQLLEDREDIKNYLYSHTRYTNLLNLPLLLILILLLLAGEWGLRKYNGEI